MEDKNKVEEFKDRTYNLKCCDRKMCVEYADESHNYPISYKCHKCGAFVIAWKHANWKLKADNDTINTIANMYLNKGLEKNKIDNG